ncbi:MAG TPA: DUF4097 family beta strand repeat-containing protein, partial [Candidatus Krumholzibacterium sp.]|nr:DUF4097 family beta strand repeat-containing protein [Candidatus Krumholzibacterium sp.]
AVTIKADLPRVRKGFFGWFGDNNEAIRVEYVVRVPHETDLDIESVNGRIDIEEVGGMFRVKTVNGGIDMDMLGGEGDVGTVNGGIGCSIRDFPHGGELNVKTLNGSVEIGLPGDLDAELDLKTTNGRIRVGFDIEDARTVKKRRVRATVGKGDGLVQVRTLNGGIRIGEL